MKTRRWLPYTGLVALASMVMAALAVVADTQQAVGEPALPSGFVLRDIPTGQAAYDLTSFAYLPDGSLLTTGKSGRITWVSATGGTTRAIAALRTVTQNDLGVVGIAVANDFARTRHIYLIRAVPSSTSAFRIRLSRFVVQGGSTPSGLGQEKVILEIKATAAMHVMTEVVVGDDGTLWVSIGDLQYPTKVQAGALKTLGLRAPAGKLLHITPSGRGVATNPYFDAAKPSSWRSRTYARGFRSPFRFSLHPTTGAPILGDVGWNTWEEVDLVRPGQNYKWPCWEGPRRTPGYRDLKRCAGVANTPPLWSYHHGSGSNQGNSVTGGMVYVGDSYPAAYQGAYFFGDYVARKIWTMRFSSRGRMLTPPQDPAFATDIGGPVKFASAPNGDIVYADILSGTLRRLSYSPGNRAPVAVATVTTDPATRTVTFNAAGSSDLDGDPLSYRWSFGDGSAGTGRRVTHTYPVPGETFEARLTVTDALGAASGVNVTVTPSNHSPVLTLKKPRRARFAVGDPIRLSAAATDSEDGALAVRWTTAIVHCGEATTCHRHPGTGKRGARWAGTFPDHPDSRLEITASARDSAGVQTRRTFVARPRQHRISLVSTVPAALQLAEKAGVRTALVTQGATVNVAATRRATDGFTRFSGWTDGVRSRTRTVTMGSRDITLRARYLTPIGRRYAASAALRRSLGSPVAPEDVSGAVRYRIYQRGRLFWSAATGVHLLNGPVLRKYRASGGFRALGVPTRDVGDTTDGRGRYADLSKNASVYWSAETGAHEVHGKIRRRWVRMGRERSFLGFPTSDVREVRGGLRADFERGFIRWRKATGKTVVHRT